MGATELLIYLLLPFVVVFAFALLFARRANPTTPTGRRWMAAFAAVGAFGFLVVLAIQLWPPSAFALRHLLFVVVALVLAYVAIQHWKASAQLSD